MKVLDRSKKKVTYYNIPEEYVEFALWMIAFNYKPGTITRTISEVKASKRRSSRKTKNALNIYNRYKIFKNEIGWKIDRNVAFDIRNKIKRLNFQYKQKFGVEAIKITKEELDKYLNVSFKH